MQVAHEEVAAATAQAQSRQQRTHAAHSSLFCAFWIAVVSYGALLLTLTL